MVLLMLESTELDARPLEFEGTPLHALSLDRQWSKFGEPSPASSCSP